MPLFVYPERDGAAVFFYAFGGFCRWLWRYRSELAPVYWTAGVVGVGAWLHAVHPHAWPIPAVVGATAGVFLAVVDRLPRVRRLPQRVRSLLVRLPVLRRRRAERIWGALVCASIGGWLTTATILGVTGPDAGPLRGLALFGMLGLGLPWWYSHDRRRLVRVRRVVEHFPDTADAAGLPGARMVSALIDRWGWTGRVKLRRGQHYRQIVDALAALESALGTRVGAARVEPVPSDAAEIVLRVIEEDPHAKPIPYPTPGFPDATGSYPGRYPRRTRRTDGEPFHAQVPDAMAQAASPSIRRPIAVGVWEDGDPVRVLLLRRHVLIGGVTGAGKSGLLNVILAELVRCVDVTLWGIDLKKGMELAPWRSCLQRLAVTADEAVHVLRAAVVELDRRAELLTKKGQREWTPTPHESALVIVVDEYAELPAEARRLADSIARRGRAVAVTLLVATQKPSQAAMGSGMAVRSQMDVRFCLRVRERRDTDLILGQGMLTAGWDPTGFDAPGKFLLSAPEHTTPRRARAYLITDPQVRQVSLQHARYASNSDRGDASNGDDRNPATSSGAIVEGEPVEDRPDPTGNPRREVVDHDKALWAALRDAPDHGATIAELMAASGLSRPSVYRRLKTHQDAGRVVQTYRGRWRSTRPTDHTPRGHET